MSPELRRAFVSSVTLLSLLRSPSLARAQACCAGTGAVTPARLTMHEDALAGVTLRASGVLGAYGVDGSYTPQPPHTTELDLEEDFLFAARVTKRGQLAALVPTVQTYRWYPGVSASGGGLGDINLGARYDFVLAGESRFIPGIALLAGATFPTGIPPEQAKEPLAVDATGIGAFQGNAGVALEQVWRAWLVNLSGIVAQRASRHVEGVDETLGTQVTGIAAVAYTFQSEAAVGGVVSYAAEGNASLDGATDAQSHKRVLTLSAVALYPITDSYRVQGSLFVTPPVSQLGANQPASAGVTVTVILGVSRNP
jgi:hypothetical protein